MLIRLSIASLAGATVASAASLAFVLQARESWKSQGESDGRITALIEVADALRKLAPPEVEGCNRTATIFTVKTTSVEVMNCAGTPRIHIVE